MRRRTVLHVLLALLAASAAMGQADSKAAGLEPPVSRNIEIMIRSQFNVPVDYKVTFGERKPSQLPGFDSLPVSFSRGANSTSSEFLLSADGKTLSRLETFDLAHNPALAIDVAERPIRGNPKAPVTVINFDDLECPYCARLHRSLFPSAMDRYADKVRFIYKDNPIVEAHPWALHAAVDANCLASQSSDVYWSYVDYVHSHGQEVDGDDRRLERSFAALDRIARQEAIFGKLDENKLNACVARQDETQVRASMKEAKALGLDGAPAVFVNGERVVGGAVPSEQIWMVIDRAMRASGIEPPSADSKPAGGSM
jgi:protein-disulfide isomerase